MALENKFHFRIEFSFCPVLSSEACISWGLNAVNKYWQLYQTVFEQTLFKCQELVQSQGGRKKFRFKNKLMSLDGSIIDLSVSMFD